MFLKEALSFRQYALSLKSTSFCLKRKACGLLLIAYCLLPTAAQAQCAMCRAALATNEGGVKAEAVNDGIVYLMAFPYLLVGGLFYYIYKTRLQKKK